MHFCQVYHFRFTNKLSEKYLSATLSTTEKYFGFKTKEMSLVSRVFTRVLKDINLRSNSITTKNVIRFQIFLISVIYIQFLF